MRLAFNVNIMAESLCVARSLESFYSFLLDGVRYDTKNSMTASVVIMRFLAPNAMLLVTVVSACTGSCLLSCPRSRKTESLLLLSEHSTIDVVLMPSFHPRAPYARSRETYFMNFPCFSYMRSSRRLHSPHH